MHISICFVAYKMADNELMSKLNRREKINEGESAPSKVSQSVYAEFKEFSILEIKEYRKIFQKYATNIFSCLRIFSMYIYIFLIYLIYIYIYILQGRATVGSGGGGALQKPSVVLWLDSGIKILACW